MSDIPAVKRRHSTTSSNRGGPQPPHSVAAAGTTKQMRVLAVKIDIDWRNEEGKKLYRQLRDLARQEAYYRNMHIRRQWAQSMGWRVNPEAGDKSDVTKQGRQQDKGDLSGSAYSACEREAAAVMTRDKHIFSGSPFPEWRPNSALTVRGHKNKAESGVRLELGENGQYVAEMQLLNKNSPGGCWLNLPLAKHAKRDEHQGDVLRAMVAWSVPILKGAIEIKQHKVILRLTWEKVTHLPPFGDRIATLASTSDGRLLLRTETQTKDYTSKLQEISSKKDAWDLIRRRVTAQIGWRHGHARLKRQALARISTEQWVKTYVHTWTREVANWCHSQGVRSIRIGSIATGDWPAWQFEQQLTYKASELGMEVVTDAADIQEASGNRTVTAALAKDQRNIKRRREAVRELAHQLGVDA